jgi:hypothetical protein
LTIAHLIDTSRGCSEGAIGRRGLLEEIFVAFLDRSTSGTVSMLDCFSKDYELKGFALFAICK